MLIAELPIAVLMQRRPARSAWCDDRWAPVAVLAGAAAAAAAADDEHDDPDQRLMPSPPLQLHSDENDGYFENWIAPEPKVFVLWQWRGRDATPVLASVSYAEGARMLDSGDPAEGVPMPREVHAWLGGYLQQHYRPPKSGRRGHVDHQPGQR
jgi:hypothetical protein